MLLALAATWTLGNSKASAASTAPSLAAQATTAAAPGQQQSALLDARSKGAPDAPITVFEVSDFQCPYCKKFSEETLPYLEREYIQSGKVRFVFLNLPLTQRHPNAAAAHEFAMCAADQDRFWPIHDLLFRYQGDWARLPDPGPYFESLADSASLDRGSLDRCLNSGAVRWLIQQEAQTNARAGIRSTPSFIIERGLLAGFAPIETWRPILDSLFAEKTGR